MFSQKCAMLQKNAKNPLNKKMNIYIEYIEKI